jgi:4-diphosphocytidyl-2-C-methyl-D-erythritol kinase
VHFLIDAPAKVNLCLLIGPRRPDGYHDLFSVFAPVDLSDRMEFTLGLGPTGGVATQGQIGLACAGIDEGGAGEGNLAVKALRSVESLVGRSISGAISIEKRIPVGAGMGGGSSDAAAALRAAARLLETEGGIHLDKARLHDLARSLGADVPFFLEGGSAVAKGIGDILEPVAIPPVPLVLLLPEEHLGTKEVYAEFDRLAGQRVVPETDAGFAARCAEAEAVWKGLAVAWGDPKGGGLNAVDVAQSLQNDLEAPSFALVAGLSDRKQALLDAGALGALMSGSGPTMFGVCRSEELADAVCGRLTEAGHSALQVMTL